MYALVKPTEELIEMEKDPKDTTEEVEDQAYKIGRFNEDEAADEADEQADSGDDDSDVEEQKRISDATLKHAIEHIADALAALV